MFGEIGGWFFRGLGDISPDEEHPGFKNTILRPNFVKELNFFKATHNGPFGLISSSWKRVDNTITYDVIIPANSSATVTFLNKSKVYLNGEQLKNTLNYHILAGNYQFEIVE